MIRQQLDRMLESRVFVQSERLSRFLRFIVEHAIEGHQHLLKEYVIGSEVYDRRPPYHPSENSIVRTEARRLRSKLKDYYEGEGKDDQIYIYLRPGSYIPIFQCRKAMAGPQLQVEAKYALSVTKASPVTIAILPFTDISRNPISLAYTRAIPDELAYQLTRTDGCRVLAPFSKAYCTLHKNDLVGMMSKVGAQIAFQGSVRAAGSHIRITASIVDSGGLVLWARRLEIESESQPLFAIEEQIAGALSVGVTALSAAVSSEALFEETPLLAS
ncbi:hypothetical protein [Acidisarcina polymorpha]|nr:hypothetical protein [Acidisarcina polymorpha]